MKPNVYQLAGELTADALISIITPSYNTAKFIGETIESVQAQTYTNWEMIIVDDYSSDNTDDVVKKYLSDKRIIYIKNDKNVGAAISRNIALRVAKGRWIAFLDSDDIWSINKLSKQINFMKKNSCYFSYTNYEEIDETGRSLGVKVTGPKRITKHGMYNYCYPGCLTVMYDAKFVGLVQIKDIKKNNDYAMWLKICQKTDCLLLDEYLGKYRRRNGSISRHGVMTMIKWHYKLWHDAQCENVFFSLWHTSCNLVFGFIKKKKFVKNFKQIGCDALVNKRYYHYVFVILVYRNSDDLISCLRSIEDNVENYRVIIVNSYFDEYTKNQVEMIAKSNKCDFLNVKNNGYGAGNNRGIEFVCKNYEFEYVIVSNPDIIIDSMLGSPNVFAGMDIIAPKIVTLNRKNQNPILVLDNNKICA